MLLLLLIYVVLRALWKINVYLISTLVNKSLYYNVTSYRVHSLSGIVCYMYGIILRLLFYDNPGYFLTIANVIGASTVV